MRTAEELDRLCIAIRTKKDMPDLDELMGIVRTEFGEYVASIPEPAPQLPPEHMVEPLWSFGWLLYELSWSLTPEVPAGWEALDDETVARSRWAMERIEELADIARDLPWPEYAPRGLGALRSLALAHSKRDTEQGFDLAWAYHDEANELHREYLKNHQGNERYENALAETVVQLWLAQSGTSSRTAEQLLGRWAERVMDGRIKGPDEHRLLQAMFDRLWQGVLFGERAWAQVAAIDQAYGLADTVTREHLALVTGYRNPGIMAARAALLLLPLSIGMEQLGRGAPPGHADWAAARDDLVERMRASYRKIERDVRDSRGNPVALNADHQRSVVQIRLNIALVLPGTELESELDFAPCLAQVRLDAQAATSLSEWLADTSTGRRRGDANVIGSATMPKFIEGVEALRAARGVSDGYRTWRRTWLELDRYIDEPGRADLLEQALGSAP